jgi:glycosyltransferase involved in cell wall biosynthesis
MSATPPLVSVLLPVRDAAPTLERCLTSLAAQTLRAHEVVAVEDGSTDGSGDVLEAWAARDPRLTVRRTPARGLVSALNTAAQAARGNLLARMDADDVCHPERLARQCSRFRAAGDVHVLGTCVELRRADGPITDGLLGYVAWQNGLLTHDDIVRDLWVESPLAHPSVMMPAAVLRDLGGYRDFDGPEDYDLWLRAERAGLRFAKLGDALLEWWDSPGRLTRTGPRYADDRFFALKLDSLESRHLGGGRAVVIWGSGPIGKRWSRALRARGHEVSAFVEVSPRKVGTHLHGAPVVNVAEAARFADALHLAAVGQRGRRPAIRAAAAALGLEDGRSLIAVA